MSSINSIVPEKLARLIGTPNAPVVVDVRTSEDFDGDPRLIPGSIRRDYRSTNAWGPELAGRPAIVVCQRGLKISQGTAAMLRSRGPTEYLEGGFEAWRNGVGTLLPESKLPTRDASGRTVWVTRERPKVDRIACPWLIRRFVDPEAVFLFVAAAEVLAVAEAFGGAPFDIEGVHWSHRGETCTFDTMIEELCLEIAPLKRLARIVRGADTSRLDLAPEAPGLLAASLGLSRMYPDDLKQLDAGMALYDAFYRWCRDATEETHNWPTNKPGATR